VRADSADNGTQAMDALRAAAARRQPYDVALVDMKMPGMSGLDLARAIQADPALSGLPLIMLTSLAAPGEATMAHRAGFSAYLNKPLRQADLRRCIARAVGTRVPAGKRPRRGQSRLDLLADRSSWPRTTRSIGKWLSQCSRVSSARSKSPAMGGRPSPPGPVSTPTSS